MSKPAIRKLTVIDKTMVTPNMRRIALSGEDLRDFPTDRLGGYIKLLLPRRAEPGFFELSAAEVNPRDCRLRSYTVRAFDPETLRLTLDFAAHDDGGPATAWARDVSVGEKIFIGGPGPVQMVDPTADWFLLAADMTGLPALSVNLERLSPDAVGHAIIEITSDDDRQRLDSPGDLSIQWLVNPHPERGSNLAAAVKAVEWRPGRPSVWVACELESMRELRTYLKSECALAAEDLYISSYWKAGATDEEHKVAKQQVLRGD